ncbi:MAG: potassium channel family protein [Desulforhopalus sp.]
MRVSILFLKAFFIIFVQLMPIWGVLAIIISVAGIFVGMLEGIGWFDGLYFGWVTGTTIGYGDIVPTRPLTKLLCVFIGLVGIVNTGLVVSIAVAAGKSVSEESGLLASIQEQVRDKLADKPD